MIGLTKCEKKFDHRLGGGHGPLWPPPGSATAIGMEPSTRPSEVPRGCKQAVEGLHGYRQVVVQCGRVRIIGPVRSEKSGPTFGPDFHKMYRTLIRIS